MKDPHYPRDLAGYGRHAPHAHWPGGARIAVQFVLNYEEGAENCVLDGDAGSETFLSEIIGAQSFAARHMSMESIYEYGSRAGLWRLLRLFEERRLPLTIFGVARALQRNREATERRHIADAVAIFRELTGAPPLGWYTGRDSPNTRRLVAEHGGFSYDADSYADDLPYWEEVKLGSGAIAPQLIVPYTLDTNDMRFAAPQGFNSGTQFFDYLKDAFDTLYREGDPAGLDRPKMLSVGLHCRLVGRPARAAALARFLGGHDQVWVTRRIDIADHWRKTHPYAPSASTRS
ncbi:MAG: hypothetical protein GAK35_02273 [Herbaspirillum frisingense]|uniref:Allantoinase PuuE n=1 Tax=Herbaspirillum frisingense TaxID=92645 RepID=A0A7V8FWD1_9BURK|nr:MAG: hypothetical protein GAK35_02273 [Herbaspirillum frisingense]